MLDLRNTVAYTLLPGQQTSTQVCLARLLDTPSRWIVFPDRFSTGILVTVKVRTVRMNDGR